MPILTRGAFAQADTAKMYKTGSWRIQKPYHQHFSAPCHNACLAGEDAQAWLAYFSEGHIQKAWETLVSVNPLPGVSGRVCHHPCETACNRGQYDEALAIHHIERYLGEQAIQHGWNYPLLSQTRHVEKIAIIGAGPAGLSAAYHLKQRGYKVDIFDNLPVAGGLLQIALPPYRLPRNALQAEIERILALGIDFQAQKQLGRDFSLEELHPQYAAIFLAIGRQNSREWQVDGVIPHHLQNGLDMLKEWIALGKLDIPDRLAVIGGGNTAIDLARILRRAGAKEVHLITHQAHPDSSENDMMNAIPREIIQAEEEGVQLHTQRGIQRLLLRGEQVIGVEMTRMQTMQHADGRSERVSFRGTETVLHVDQVVPAIGQQLDLKALEHLSTTVEGMPVTVHGQTDQPHIFAGGDMCLRSSGTVSGAIGDGYRAAIAIHHTLQNTPLPHPTQTTTITVEQLNLHYYESSPRLHTATLTVEERCKNDASAEVETGFNDEQAKKEATRCLSCGNCMACDNCWTFCPDSAILKTQENASNSSHYVFDYDYCKGCGLCKTECPCGFIIMQDEA